MTRLQPYVLLSLLIPGVVATLGCDSGGLSQNDLKRMALSRGRDDDDNENDDDRSEGTPKIVNGDEDTPSESDSPTDNQQLARAVNPPKVDTRGGHSKPRSLDNSSTANFPSIGQVAAKPEETADLAIGNAPLNADAMPEERLARLGAALNRYAETHNRFPTQAIQRDGQPLLSWRVELLPYLGYTDLYTKFQFDQPWDSRQNQALLAHIPTEFRSGGGTDTQVLAIQCGSPLISAMRPTATKRVLDGLANTIAFVEVSSSHAVPWTKPEDMSLPRTAEPFGEPGGPSFWATFGDGTVHAIKKDIGRVRLSALFSYDDETGMTPSQVAYVGDAEETTKVATPGFTTTVPGSVADGAVSVPRRGTPAKLTAFRPDTDHSKIPSAAQLAEANDSLRTIYQERYKRAKERDEKIALAQEMLDGTRELDSDPPAQFALLRLCANIAAETAELSLVQKSVERRVERFPEWDDLSEYSELLQTVYKSGKKNDRRLADLAVQLAERAMDEGSFVDADAMGDLAANIYKSARPEEHPNAYLRMKRRFNEFRGWRGRVDSAMETLAKDEDDANANLVVGRYYCFFRERWSDGLPLLAQSGDPALKRLAELELNDSGALEQEVQLADEWWTTGETVKIYRRDYQLRACHWYQKALESGVGGVAKLRAEVRVKDAEERYLKGATR